jgi:O-antigen/teichoic acid export membrane protein
VCYSSLFLPNINCNNLNLMISKNLIKSSLIYTVFGALPMVSGFILLLFYTNINYINKSDFGAFIIYISFTLFVQTLINLGLDTYIGVSYFENKHNKLINKSKIGAITGYLLLWGLIVSVIFSLSGENIFRLVFQSKDIFFYPYGFMAVITAFCNSYFKTYTNLLINQEKSTRFALVNSVNFILTLGISLSGLFLYPLTLVGPMWGRLLSGIGIFLIAFISFSVEFPFRITLGNELKHALRFSLPVLLFLLLSWSISNIYPFIMKYFMTLNDVAIFGLVIQLTLLVEFLLNGMSSAIIPKVFGLIVDKKLTGSTPELNKYFSGFNAFALLVIPASSFFIPLILPLIISKDYEASFIFLSMLNIGFASRGLYNYFLTPIYIFKKTNVLPKMYLITAIFQIIITVLLIKYFGIWGAVFANLITKVIQNLFLFLASRKFFIYKFNALKFIWLPLIITIVIICSEYFVTLYNIHIIRLLQMAFSYLIVYIFYRNEAESLLKDLFSKVNIRFGSKENI